MDFKIDIKFTILPVISSRWDAFSIRSCNKLLFSLERRLSHLLQRAATRVIAIEIIRIDDFIYKGAEYQSSALRAALRTHAFVSRNENMVITTGLVTNGERLSSCRFLLSLEAIAATLRRALLFVPECRTSGRLTISWKKKRSGSAWIGQMWPDVAIRVHPNVTSMLTESMLC